MNPVNATALYVSASRLVLNYDPGDPQAFSEVTKLLPYFRQSLSCCVCGITAAKSFKQDSSAALSVFAGSSFYPCERVQRGLLSVMCLWSENLLF
ncbi:E3 ubiquitin-protein ligase MSL2 isoform X5 [Mauremys reevesii]|uniref:E3 ubiquitin-protein ligase MSL2 isoform X5 n=1 Tax=Mauremys reevesii TaxID=260615 RepID=UPI00193F3032|nr:E3 ubiquitin-protein ligase MSL2 isoform X5 [Mauremys reevesii]